MRTETLDSCCRRPQAIIGILLANLHNLDATLTQTSFIKSLVYEPTGIQPSESCSISRAFASTCFFVLEKLSNAKILAYSGGKDSCQNIILANIMAQRQKFQKWFNLQRQEHTLGSHVEVLKDLTPLYLANRFRAGTSIGVSTSSGYSG